MSVDEELTQLLDDALVPVRRTPPRKREDEPMNRDIPRRWKI